MLFRSTGARDRIGRGLDCFTALARLGLPRGPFARNGGEGGIRTLDTREGITVFETARFSRSRTSPRMSVPENVGMAQVGWLDGVGGQTPYNTSELVGYQTQPSRPSPLLTRRITKPMEAPPEPRAHPRSSAVSSRQQWLIRTSIWASTALSSGVAPPAFKR